MTDKVQDAEILDAAEPKVNPYSGPSASCDARPLVKAEDAAAVRFPERQAEPQGGNNMLAMIERAISTNSVSLDKLEKLLEMQERYEAREARKAFDRAIADAKSEIPPIIKNRRVKFKSKNGGSDTDYRHEDLAGIAAVVDPILTKHGLSYRYRSKQHDGGLIEITCVLSHRDGYSEETSLKAGRDDSGNKNNFQAVGSAATYLQRYTLKLALGLASAHDDDAQDADGGDEPAETISGDQFAELNMKIEEAGLDPSVVEKAERLTTLHELPVDRFAAVMRKLDENIAKQRGAK